MFQTTPTKRKHENREDNPELRGRGEQDGLEKVLGYYLLFRILLI